VLTSDFEPQFTALIDPLRAIERIRPYRYGLWSIAVARKLLELQPNADAIEFVDSQAEAYVSLTSRKVRSRWQGIPMYVRAHTPMFVVEEMSGMNPDRFGRDLYHRWEREAIRHADGIVAPSCLLLNAIAARGLRKVIPNPVTIETAKSNVHRQPQIVFVGNIEPNKGVVEWVASLDEVFRRHSTATALMIGSDTPTSPLGTSMAEYASSLINPGYRHRLEYASCETHENVQRLLRRASLAVVPSRFESFSYFAAEAIAQGCPVLASESLGISEHVPSLIRVDVTDSAAFAAAQLELLNRQCEPAPLSQCQMELAAACDPTKALAQLSEFIDLMRGTPQSTDHDAATDSMDAMESLLAQTLETAESFRAQLSSVRS
jgi:glycogen(starch) synthase